MSAEPMKVGRQLWRADILDDAEAGLYVADLQTTDGPVLRRKVVLR